MDNDNITATDKNELFFDFKNTSNPDTKISDIFFDFTEWYNSQYKINKSVLVLRSMTDLSLSAVSTWEDGARRDGLTLRLPMENSLFEQVIGNGKTFHALLSDDFSGNFFEKKLLLNNSTKSYILQPLKYKNDIIGLIGFSSDSTEIYSDDKKSIFSETSSKLAEIIQEKLINI